MTDREPLELAVETPYSRAYAAGRKSGLEDASFAIMVDFPDGIESMLPTTAHILACGLGADAIRALIEKEASK